MIPEPTDNLDPDVHTVIIELNRYMPEELHIKRRDSVIWKNNDNRLHTITWAAADFENAEIALNQTHEQVFDDRGTYYYFCNFHDNMRGVIYVE